ncbi:TetR/AcrR family transcriptional regulator [Planctomonas psychrotolerans]|uniref:TetR/AcrR family transcriptional regulator n=1 Tax=Planctomonas psychrotolerans TaxID=2528712 RepID=UPI00123B71AD|nr:TetR/AcrR family transcriptional regulator [Planctomonas psychrotolerans]
MARKANPNRRVVLLEGITEALFTRSIGEISFRSLAESLGVSTYTLVYHFGTREELLKAILQSVTDRQNDALGLVDAHHSTVEAFIESFHTAFAIMVDPANRQLQRIEFEAAMMGVMSPDLLPIARGTFDLWLDVSAEALRGLGLSAEPAHDSARFIIDAMYGLKYDLVLTGDTARVRCTFDSVLTEYREKVVRQLSQEPGGTAPRD